ncbi:hypothetical protein E4U21_006068 [Claviceps maximensis]|nr:hypothetical protein E4U21_006068 [Claviceps maximensis]
MDVWPGWFARILVNRDLLIQDPDYVLLRELRQDADYVGLVHPPPPRPTSSQCGIRESSA